jgi:hypothetical protein
MSWTTGQSMFDPRQRRKGLSCSFCVQTGSVAHPASCTMGIEGSFSGCKARPGRDADHSLHLVPRSRMSRSYNSSPPKRLRCVYWNSFSFRFYIIVVEVQCSSDDACSGNMNVAVVNDTSAMSVTTIHMWSALREKHSVMRI